LAARSLLFRNATAAAGWTKPSVPSFFTGLYPIQHGVYEGSARDRNALVSDVLPDRAVTLAEVLHAEGYQTAAFVENTQLRAGLGFEQGFDLYADDAGDARAIRSAALDWVDDRKADAPFLLYLHLLDAHWPYDIPKEYAERFADARDTARFRGDDSRALRDAINDGTVVLDPTQREALGALYDGSLRFIDDELQRLFDGLEQRGLADRTVISVIADHGEEFLEHGRVGHGHGLWENLLRVPWILHVPGRRARTVDAAVNLVDLPLTLLGACGTDRTGALDAFPEAVDRLADPDRPRPTFAEHKDPGSYQQSLRSGTLKLTRIWHPPAHAAAEAAPAGPAEAAPRPAVGSRWEAEVDVDGDGTLRALQLKPRDEPASDPVEIKATVSALDGDRFVLAGVRVSARRDTELTGDAVARAGGLREGLPVKASGTVAGGVLVAERLKFYAPGDSFTPEVRGTVTLSEPGHVELGGIALVLDERTAWKGVETSDLHRPQLAREELLAALQLGSTEAVRRGWRIESRLYDLARDARELAPEDASSADAARLSSLLDELGASLSRHRLWSVEDRENLDGPAEEQLRAIGYVR
ncbi:MAG TPA: sulfatase-like hydrolase/transferase, partial [Planctomycetota bacterium]|nr:sulfatase-like hydrolase/transferase [Planctomycetota bacterium]